MYIRGDYWMVCDRCGGHYRRSEMREEWTGLWVCIRGCWESRHPQDFVTGVEDNTSVPVVRSSVKQTVGETTLNGDVLEGAVSATLTDSTGAEENDPIGIVMDNGAITWTYLTADPAAHVCSLGSPMLGKASSGNVVYLPSINSESWAD